MHRHLIQAFTRSSLLHFKPTAMKTTNFSSSAKIPSYETLKVTVPKPFVYHVEMNRPDKLNAMNDRMWTEVGQCFNSLGDNDECRVVLFSGAGRLFSAGIDFKSLMGMAEELADQEDVARRCKILRKTITRYQESMSSLEKCVKPVICLIHGACLGGGLNLIASSDIRYCTEDAYFVIKEVDLGLAADVGILQRLPKIVSSQSLVNELAFSARPLKADEAKECGLVNRVYSDKETMVKEALSLAENIANKSPVAVQMTKRSIVYSRDHSVEEGLEHIANWNQTMLQSEDFMNSTVAQATKSPLPVYAKL